MATARSDGKNPPDDNPSCIFCSGSKTDDVTPDQFPKTDRLYLCQWCKRKFVVRFVLGGA